MNVLDTDVIVELLRERRHEAGAVSVITIIEVLRGVEPGKRNKVKELLEETFSPLNIDNKVIDAYCNLYQRLKEEGTTIPDTDLLIAATAISKNMNLKTGDKHFERLRTLGLNLT